MIDDLCKALTYIVPTIFRCRQVGINPLTPEAINQRLTVNNYTILCILR